MAEPHPSLTLVFDVDESLATETTRLEVGRCYDYVGSTVVRAHKGSEGTPVTNTCKFMVKLGNRKYLRSSDEGADELWRDVIERWLYDQIYTVSNNMQIYNRRQREIGNDELYFDRVDVELEDGALTVAIKPDSTGAMPADLAKSITQVRDALNKGLLGAEPCRVELPSQASYEHQQRAWEERKQTEEEGRAEEQAAREAAEEEAKEQAVQEAAADFVESPDLVETPQEDMLKKIRAEVEAKYRLPDADFAIDYKRWGIVDHEGHTREYDSTKHAFLGGE